MPEPRFRAEFRLLTRFATTGVVNTLVGMAVIMALDLGLRMHPVAANACGYAAGLCTGWLLHRRFVFQSSDGGWGTGAKYMAAFALAFAANLAVLRLANAALGGSNASRAFAQLIAVATYTSVQFALLRLWVFPRRRTPTADEGG